MKILKLLSITLLLSLCFGFSPSKATLKVCCASSDKYIDSGRVKTFPSTIDMPFSKNALVSNDARFIGEIGTSVNTLNFDFHIGYKELYIRDHQWYLYAISAKNVKTFMFSQDSKFAYIEFEDGLKVTYDLCDRKEVSCEK